VLEVEAVLAAQSRTHAKPKYPSLPASGLRALLTGRRLRQQAELENAAAGC
jgi:hypothetical protein